jgi:hypothetical protein
MFYRIYFSFASEIRISVNQLTLHQVKFTIFHAIKAEIGWFSNESLFLWANLCWSFIARKEIRKCWSNVLQVKQPYRQLFSD